MGTLAELMDSLADDAARRGRQFERISKWYLENEPLFADQLRQVWLRDRWPGRWGADAGIDLVAEDREGRLWAIQAKAYDPSYSVTKTLAVLWISEQLPSKRALVLLPLLSLLAQTVREWTANAHGPFEFLAVCSDETVVGGTR